MGQVRKAFEKWITAPPFERAIDRFSSDSVWEGQYRSYDVQLSWVAYQAGIEYLYLQAQKNKKV